MRRFTTSALCLTFLLIAACVGPQAARPGITQFEQLERELNSANTFAEEYAAMLRMNQWLLSDDCDPASTSFGLSWTVGDANTPAPPDIRSWLEAHPEGEIWVHTEFNSEGEKRRFSHRLIDRDNWYTLTLNE